jgi:carbon-monoxide dehydrogenase small subunit
LELATVNDRRDVGVSIVVNGNVVDTEVESRVSLADFLRQDLGLTGTHVGCEHGVCGACTVLLDGQAVRSCLLFAAQADGCVVETVESLADGTNLHPLQRAFSAHHGLQCGFCTPGFLMLIVSYLAENPSATDDEIRDAISSNLCRCTGYQGILDAARDYRDSLGAVG